MLRERRTRAAGPMCLVAGVALGVLLMGRFGLTKAPADYELVKRLLSGEETERERAIEQLAELDDRSLLAALNDVLYYYVVIRNRTMVEAIDDLMSRIAGVAKMGENPRRGWAEWIGHRDEIEPRPGYVAFKRWLFLRYDPSFRSFFHPRFPFRIRPEEIEWGGVTRDGIPALQRPGFISADAADYLSPSDRVFGIEMRGQARAYPHRIMDWHEMCNDVIGGVPVSLSYCTLCGAGILFEGRVGNRTFTFGSSGLLYRSNKLMYDHQTGSLWSQLTGEPVGGPLATSGLRLKMLPLVVTTWGQWRARHPDTLVLDVGATGFEREYDRSPYEAYYQSAETMFPVWLRDGRLESKEKVYGIVIQGEAKAYPVERLKEEGIVHDVLRGQGIVLVTESESGAVRVYASGEQHFRSASAHELVDTHGRQWAITESGLVHEATGERLPRIAGVDAYWFGWYAFHPTTLLYSDGEDASRPP